MTGDSDSEDAYTYEPSIAEQGIRSLVRKAAQRGYGNHQIRRAVREMLRDNRVAEPTNEQLDHDGATREMAAEFGDRLDRARERLSHADEERMGTTGVEVLFDVGERPVENDGRPISELLPDDKDPEVAAIVQKMSYGYKGPKVESQYPLVIVGDYAVCTCPDRHYNRRDGGTCYHELAYDFLAGERESNAAHDDAVVRV